MAYTSQYDAQVNELFNKINNRDPFQYNASDDQMYQQYVDRYQNMGRKAMMDTVGQGAALTGGYNNTYAQNAGQQAYDEYLQGINDKVMDFYNLAYGQYQDQGADMYNLFNAAGTLAQNDFDRYMQEAQLQLAREQFEWQKSQAGGRGGGGGGGYGKKSTKKTNDYDNNIADPGSWGSGGSYNLGELLSSSAKGWTSDQIAAGLQAKGVDISNPAVQQDIKWARSK